jgi:NAD(P)-dependent dehydrogenase (short-subunit alcohol dehydrogenase family)
MIKFSENDLILVTGASSGIGKATAHLLNQLGARVVATGRNKKNLQQLKELVPHPDRLALEPRDLVEDIEKLPEWVISLSKKHGKFKGLAHAAGVVSVSPLSLEDLNSMKNLFDLNYFASINLVKGITQKKSRQPGLSIVLLSSISAILGFAGICTYGASKAALDSAVRSMAREYGRYAIRINSVLPGNLENVMQNQNKDLAHLSGKATQALYEERMQDCCLKGVRIGGLEDVANLCAFLLSDKSRWITGQNISVDGGESA